MLKLITVQEKDTLSSDERQELTSYIKSLSSSYQNLYGRYDRLMEKLQSSMQRRNSKNGRSSGSSSSDESSDSESNEFFTPKKVFHVNSETEIHRSFQSPLARSDIGDQQSEIVAASKLAEKESTIMGLSEDLKQSKEIIAKLEAENTKTLLKLEEFKQEQEMVKQMLRNVRKENETLLLEKSTVHEKFFASEEFNKKMTRERDSLKGDVLKLESQNTQLLNDLNDALRDEEDKNKSVMENVTMPNKLQTAENEIKRMEKEVEKLREQIAILEQNVNVLQDQKSNLEGKLEEKSNEVMSLQMQLSEPQNAKSIENEPTVSHVNNLQQELNSLRSQYDLEEQASAMVENISEGMILMGKLESEVISKISTHMTRLIKQKDTFDRIMTSCKLLKDEVEQKKLEETEAMETIRQLKMIQEDLEKNISRLQDDLKEAISKLKLAEAQKAEADKEVKKLNELNQTLEVRLRLLDQKLKITKSEFKEKDENHKRKIKDLQERHQKLDDHCESLYGGIRCMKDQLGKIKVTVEAKIEDLGDSCQDSESVFEEKCGLFVSRLSKFVEELRIAKQDLGTMVSNKQEKENKKLKEEMRNIEEKLAEKEKEKDGIAEKMHELEQRVKEKEEEGQLKDEEKREAIRQLCLSIEYHREICDHLSQNLSGNRKRTISSR